MKKILKFLVTHSLHIVIFLAFLIVPVKFIYSLAIVQPVEQAAFIKSGAENLPLGPIGSQHKVPTESLSVQKELVATLAFSQIEAAILDAHLQISKIDSIGLYLSLPDSAIDLEIKGVPLRICKIHSYKINPVIAHLKSEGRLHEWLAPPFILQKESASLPKSPIRVKEAPKDTVEASQAPIDSIPVENQPVHFILEFNRGLIISVSEVRASSFSESMKQIWHNFGSRSKLAGHTLEGLLRKESPRYRAEIELVLTHEDAKAIYRAIPHDANLVLRP